MAVEKKNTLHNHLLALKNDERVFENAFEGISRMILQDEIEKVVVNGKTTYDFKIFRRGKKHIVGMYDEINSFVSYVKDASEGGSSQEMAYVLVGEPGNGKTYFVEYVSRLFREFLSEDRNRKYTFRFTGLDKIGTYGKIATIESQTYEDPAILGMNLFETEKENRGHLARKVGLSDEQIDKMWENFRPLGACSSYIWNDLRNHCDGKLDLIESALDSVSTEMVIPDTGSTRDRIAAVLVWLAGYLSDAEARGSACMPALVSAAQYDHAVRDAHHRFSAARRQVLIDLIDGGKASGELTTAADSQLLAEMLVGPLFYGRLMSGQLFPPDRVSEIIDVVLT